MVLTTEILEREERVNRELPDARRAPTSALRAAMDAWASAVWAVAAAAGVTPLPPATLDRGVAIAARPVFVCGAHRSGTTLVRDLLDGHPALVVLPSEGMFFTSFEARLRDQSWQARLEFLGTEWLRRLASSINQPPFWLLGRSTDGRSPYVAFARALHTWWFALKERVNPSSASWPLASVALAYASTSTDLPPSLARWVDKTPTNEQFLDRIWTEYPNARVIHVVRDPVAVFASRLQLEVQSKGRFGHARRILRDLARSHEIAAARLVSAPATRYRVIRYEDLLRDPEALMAGLAQFLGIEFLPALLTATVAGQPSSTNSSFGVRGAKGTIVPPADDAGRRISLRDRELIAATLGDAARALGYSMTPINRWRGRLLRLASQVR